MTIRPKLRTPLLVAALAACGATAWATNLQNSSYVPLASNETVVAEPVVVAKEEAVVLPAGEPALVPVSEARVEPALTIEEKRLTEDQRIQAQVIDLLAGNPRLSGKIGVESQDAVVRLSGYTTTAGQAWRAGRDAGGVMGVKHVVNEIRPRIGGSV